MWFVQSKLTAGERTLFRGSLGHFFAWARMEHLLDGQRSRLFDRILPRLRNRAAHPTAYTLTMPTDSALTIRDIGEVVNRLWGARTAGGRIFPSPIRREAIAIGWDAAGTSKIQQSLEQLQADDSRPDWTYVIVRAASNDDLWAYDSDFDTCRFPVDHLWGPGVYRAAAEWATSHGEDSDEVDHLDRWFAIRVESGRIDPPRNPGQFVGLPPSEQSGTWYLLRADYPVDAFGHARTAAATGSARCSGRVR
ncbi:MAG: hypothetical protein DLM66_09025 [Candidatus Dormiibacter spiritus]|nr:MAG: hypothetical protein DLM66_09025 [Candidatus Dormibacteraeota bacterium]